MSRRVSRGDGLGARMKLAAEQAGLSGLKIAEAMDVSELTIYRWWKGGQRPGSANLKRYAGVVGKSVGWLEGEEEDVAELSARFLLRALERATEGGSVTEVYDREFPPEWLSPAERKLLNDLGVKVTARLEATEGMPWSAIPLQRRQAFLLDYVQQITGIDLSGPGNGG